MSIQSGILWGLLFSFSTLLGQEDRETVRKAHTKWPIRESSLCIGVGIGQVIPTQISDSKGQIMTLYSVGRASGRPANSIFCE